MVYTALELITESMREVGAIAINEALEAHEVTLGMTRLNGMLGALGADGLMIRAAILENFPLVAGVASYTIGIGSVFNTTKPYSIQNAYVRDTYHNDTPLNVISQDEYDTLEDKLDSWAIPDAIYYNPGASQQAIQTGIIYLNPPPDQAYTLWINSNKILTEIATAATTMTFEPVYYEFLLYNLAKRLWTPYHDDGKPVRPDLMLLARQSKKVLETLNSKNVLSRTDLPGSKRGQYNIYTDE